MSLGARLVDSYENAGSVSSLVLTNMSSTYKFYEVYGWIDPAGTDNRFRLQESGTSNTNSVYGRRIYHSNFRYGNGFSVQNADAYGFRIQHYQGGDMNIHLQIFNSQVATTHTQIIGRYVGQYGGGSQMTVCHFNFKNDSIVDGLEFFEVGGATLNGYLYMYGYK